MFLRRFYHEPLAQASYMLGCQAAGIALVVDPNRNSAQYLTAALEEDVRIAHVAETHIHADFLSGSRQLAHETGAKLLLSGEGGDAWQYAFAREASAVLLHEGDSFEVGAVRIDVRHTPGHTPEHLTFLITDRAGANRPMGALTGDFIFVGDVGRPDLLERAARVEGTMEASARHLFRSLRRFAALPDYLQLWPGHGAGSACGKALGAMPQSTLGYERLFNWAFAVQDEAEFVAEVLEGQPEPPTYFAMMKRMNREGPVLLTGRPEPRQLPPPLVAGLLANHSVIVDLRPAAEFRSGHIPGTLSIPIGRSFTGWAGWLLPYDSDIHLIVAGTGHAARAVAEQAASELALIGMDRVAGYFAGDTLDEWRAAGTALESVEEIDASTLSAHLVDGDVQLIDVRGSGEWEAEHIAGSRNIPLGELSSRVGELDSSRPVVLHCASGARSTIASGVLLARGVSDVINLSGGIAAWREAGLPVERAD